MSRLLPVGAQPICPPWRTGRQYPGAHGPSVPNGARAISSPSGTRAISLPAAWAHGPSGLGGSAPSVPFGPRSVIPPLAHRPVVTWQLSVLLSLTCPAHGLRTALTRDNSLLAPYVHRADSVPNMRGVYDCQGDSCRRSAAGEPESLWPG